MSAHPTPKVFGLGLARTGTTSLHHAMSVLGLRSAPSSAVLVDGLDAHFLASHDAFFDNPIPFLRDERAERVPDARFIVTWRPEEAWLRSMAWLFGPGLARLSPDLRALGDRVHRHGYGIDTFDADVLLEVHRRHYAELRTWSRDRSHVLWLDTDEGLTWGPLCELLDRPVPDVPFPRLNAAAPRRFRWPRQLRRR